MREAEAGNSDSCGSEEQEGKESLGKLMACYIENHRVQRYKELA
jgi:hypothetical protein